VSQISMDLKSSNLFQNKYRIKSSRLEGYDYSREGAYFITICTKDKKCWFGGVVDGKIVLSNEGKIVNEEWQKTSEIRDNVDLDAYMIMPNHFHGIIVIQNNTVETTRGVVSNKKNRGKIKIETFQRNVSTGTVANSLGSIVGQFKSKCTKRIQKHINSHFAWQPRFYDHIIRSHESLDKIRNYIYNNPVKWEFKWEYPDNMWD